MANATSQATLLAANSSVTPVNISSSSSYIYPIYYGKQLERSENSVSASEMADAVIEGLREDKYEIAGIVSKSMSVSPKYIYINRLKGRGWAGDVRKMRLSIRIVLIL